MLASFEDAVINISTFPPSTIVYPHRASFLFSFCLLSFNMYIHIHQGYMPWSKFNQLCIMLLGANSEQVEKVKFLLCRGNNVLKEDWEQFVK